MLLIETMFYISPCITPHTLVRVIILLQIEYPYLPGPELSSVLRLFSPIVATSYYSMHVEEVSDNKRI